MIEVKDLVVKVGGFQLNDIDLRIPQGQYCALMGRTGSGKTTLLEAICGLKPVTKGQVFLGGEEVTHWPINQRGIGLVPQDLALFPTKTIRQHLAFGPKLQKWKAVDIQKKVDQLSNQLNLNHVLNSYPRQLSGGEKQRVALGRALSINPKVLCLDEPLSALDDQTKMQMIEVLKQVFEVEQVTVLHITHSEAEARLLTNRLVKMEDVVK